MKNNDSPQVAGVGINDGFLSEEQDKETFLETWTGRFEVEERSIFKYCKEIIESLGDLEGKHLLDVGSGTGLFLKPFSKALGENGKLYCIDIADKFIDYLKERADKEGVKNCEIAKCSDTDIPFGDNLADIAFICDVYHHLTEYDQFLKSLSRVLKPNAIVVIIDFEKEADSSEWILGHVRAGKKTVYQEIKDAGYEFIKEIDLLQLGEKPNYFSFWKNP